MARRAIADICIELGNVQMDRDPYELCPCGSGNKLKFCCADVATEMEKIERLLANNQPRMGMQGLEKLYEAHPDSQWVRTLLGSTLINEDRPDEAKKVLAGLLKQHPQQPFGNALYALAAFNADGYPESKRAVHRAFKHSTAAFPELIAPLTSAISDQLASAGAPMAARQYRVLSLRLASEEMRRELIEELVELDSDITFPYPLRSVRHPLPMEFSGDEQSAAQMAQRYSAVGCWEEAADILEKLTETHPDNAPLWYNLGLYRAWDADHARAIAAFRKASQTSSDFDRAVEYETLAQLLERAESSSGRRMRLQRFNVSSVSQILSRLDNAERLARIDPRDGSDSRQTGSPAGSYLILNRPVVEEEEDYANWTWESVPQIEARLTIFDRDAQSDQPAQAFLVGLEGEELERSLEVVRSAGNEFLEPVEDEGDEADDAFLTGNIPPEELPLRWSGYVPSSAPAKVGRRTAEEHWQRIVHDVWPETASSALGERTPLDCRGDEGSRVPLAAALIVFDAYTDSRSYLLEIDDLRERFQIEAPQPLKPDENTNINLLTIMEIQRLPLGELSQLQFEQVLKRATLVRHGRLLYSVMCAALDRPEVSAEFEPRESIISTLARVCGASLKTDEALEWINRGRELAEQQPHSFEHVLEWKMREVTLRMEDPEDERLHVLLEDLWQNYGAKLPQLREYLVNLADAAGVTPPWESAIVTPAAVGAAGETWRGGAESSAASGKKLWLPGDAD